MDVFQVLTLCSLLGVMFVGVLAYGMYRNWQRDQLELIRAPSVDPDISNVNDSTQRIYPNIRISSEPKPKKVRTPVRIADESQSSSEDPKEAESDPQRVASASVETSKKSSPSSQSPKSDSDVIDAMSKVAKALPERDGLSQSKVEPKPVCETPDRSRTSDSSKVEDDVLSAFRRSGDSSEEKNEEAKSKPLFRRVKNSSRLERKPPQASKRRKSKAEASSKGAARDSSGSPDSRGNIGEDFVMFFVLGEHDNSFRMNEVGHFLLDRGLVFDEMGLFCRKDRDSGEVLFKVSDVFFPGTFDPEDLEQYRTGGISLAMKIPNVNNAQVVFEQMLSLANECAERFQGTVKDENCNSMSNQTLAHYRSRVSDFRRMQLTMYA